MTKTELNKYRNILETRQAEIEQVIRNREAITIEKSPDALDEVQHAAERELAIRNLDRESNLLRNVRAALRRIDEGTYARILAAAVASDPTAGTRRHVESMPYASPETARLASRPRARCGIHQAQSRALAQAGRDLRCG